MKEIRYDGDLYEKICEDRKKDITAVLLSIGMILNLVIAWFSENSISWCLTAMLFGSGLRGLKIIKYINSKEIEKAIYKMKKDADIEVSCDELQKAKIIASKTEMKYDFNVQKIKKSKEEKIVEYFEFLDKQDQIQILKQVKTVIEKQNIDNELYLLEDEDLEKEGIQYVKYKETK